MNKIRLTNHSSNKIFFISDTHFCHEDILKIENSPFETVFERDEELIFNWNFVVNKRDHVFFLGDFAHKTWLGKIRPIFNELKGRKYLISGNHDYSLGEKLHWDKKFDQLILIVDNQVIHLSHYPLESWYEKNKGSWHLCGHSHVELKNQISGRVNVAACLQNYTPIDFDTLKEKIEQN